MSSVLIVCDHALGHRVVQRGSGATAAWDDAGERGVDRAAEILSREIRRTMQLLGTRTIDELGPQHVKLP